MILLFENKTDFDVTEDLAEMFECAVNTALEYEKFSSNVEVGLTLTDNAEIHRLNLKFRGIDRATDVLSFPMINFGEEETDFSGNAVPLGDIVISVDRAKEQAEEYGHSLKRELGFLTVHSMLHLMGYDHLNKEEERIMFGRQEEILNKMGLKR